MYFGRLFSVNEKGKEKMHFDAFIEFLHRAGTLDFRAKSSLLSLHSRNEQYVLHAISHLPVGQSQTLLGSFGVERHFWRSTCEQ